MWSCKQSLVTLAFLQDRLLKPQHYKDLTFFEGVFLTEVQ